MVQHVSVIRNKNAFYDRHRIHLHGHWFKTIDLGLFSLFSALLFMRLFLMHWSFALQGLFPSLPKISSSRRERSCTTSEIMRVRSDVALFSFQGFILCPDSSSSSIQLPSLPLHHRHSMLTSEVNPSIGISTAGANPCKPKVLIAGAGLGGVTLAILLKKADIPFMILEKATEVKPMGNIRYASFFLFNVCSISLIILTRGHLSNTSNT